MSDAALARESKQPSRHEWRAALACAIALGFLLIGLVARWLDQFSWSDDEGVFVFTAQALHQGHALYERVWYNYLPGFARWLQMATIVAGPSIIAARLAVLLLVLLLLGMLWVLMRRRFSPWAATWCLALLVAAPHFVALSGAAMADAPSALLAGIAVVAVLPAGRSDAWCLRLAVGGLALGLSLWFKPTSAATALPLACAALAIPRANRVRLGRLGYVAVFAAGPLLLSLVTVNAAGLTRQFLESWQSAQGAFPLDLAENLSNIWDYFWNDNYALHHTSLLIAAGVGLVWLGRHRRSWALVLGVWFLVVVGSLAGHAPLYRHHLVQLLLPAAVLAGLGLTISWEAMLRERRWWARSLAVLLLVLTIWELVAGIWLSAITLGELEADHGPASQRAMVFLRAHTQPGDLMMTDAHMLALRTGLTVPPETTNTSRMRIKAGQLTSQQMIAIAQRDQPKAIVFWEKKLASLDAFAEWVDCQYDLGVAYSERFRIYLRRPAATEGMEPVQQRFGTAVELLGYHVVMPDADTPATLGVNLVWQRDGAVDTPLTGFIHVLDAQGERVTQHDGVAAEGRCPVANWRSGEPVLDRHPLCLQDVPEGAYSVVVGMYDDEGTRLEPGLVVLGDIIVVNDETDGRRVVWNDQ